MSNAPARIFISYSHRDEGLRDELVAHLSLLQHQGLIATWFDRMISPGDQGDDVINANLERADIVLLLVSADFINSLYCWEKELTRSLERHEAKEAIVVPIVVRAVDLQGASIGSIQSLPTDRRPVTSWPNRDEAWADVSRGIRKAVEQVQERQRRFHQSHDIEQIGQVLGSRSQPEQFGDGIATGFASLDSLLSGLHPSDLVVIGGRPTMGKTTFAMNIALNVAFLAGRSLTVGVFSMETSREALAHKMISALARVDNNELRSGRFDDLAWSRINAAIGLLKRAPLYVDDTPQHHAGRSSCASEQAQGTARARRSGHRSPAAHATAGPG